MRRRPRLGEGFVVGDGSSPFPDGLRSRRCSRRVCRPRTRLFERVAGSGARIPLASVRLIAPLEPASIRDFVAFEEHVEGVSAGVEGKSHVAPEWYQAPTFYFTNPHTVLGPGEAVSPPVTERLDFELELAAGDRRRRRARTGRTSRPRPRHPTSSATRS